MYQMSIKKFKIKMKENLYIQYENNFFDKIINKKRIEMVDLIKKN